MPTRSRPDPSTPSCSPRSKAAARTSPRSCARPTGAENEQSVVDALWRLTWAGRVTNDTFAPVRALVSGGSQAHRVSRRTPRARLYRGAGRVARRVAASVPPRPPAIGGRWSLLPAAEPDAALRATATASLLLDRYGVVTRGAVQSEGVPGGFAQTYRVLAGLRRGRALPARLRHREARRGAVRGIRDGRPPARVRRAVRSAAAARRHARRDRPRESVRRGARMAGARRRHASSGTQGGRARRAGRRCPRAVPRARREVGARLHRRGGRARRRHPRPRRDGPCATARHADDRAGQRCVRLRHGGRTRAEGCRFRRVSARTHAAAADRGRRPSTGSGTGREGARA